uniref:Uncharacterized protein n=1 Tax=Panagrolaimus sp. ES5 TaxID=591445 RepID=A0AC34F4L3_9BILA
MTKKFIDLLNPTILKSITIHEISESFDFKLFAAFMDANPSIDFSLYYVGHISDENARILQDYVDKIIENSSYKTRKIVIRFPQISDENAELLESHYF